MHPTQKDLNIYEINLFQGIDFYSIDKDFKTLYDNFHPVYYLYDYWGVKVTSLSRRKSKVPELYFQFILNSCEFSEELKFIAYQLRRGDYFQKDHKIEYLFENQKCRTRQGSSKILVNFEKRITMERIDIQIIDEDGWFIKNYEKLHKLKKSQIQSLERISIERKVGKNQMEYFYKQPQNQRHRIFSCGNEEHYSLALQGGGIKGISYIGVNQALKQEHGEDFFGKISSIIGSSAGGILGLAFCCSMDQSELLQIVSTMGKIPFIDKITLDQGLKQKGKTYVKQLCQTLIQFGLVQPALLSFIQDVLENQKISRALIQLLQIYNCELAELFLEQDQGKKTLNFARLLSGELMYGNEVSKIACKCLAKVFGEKTEDFLKKITFKELYKRTKIEFTCTSVDLEDQILRFFNHKTTPDMPVTIAVQMTGSFPVAFRRQKWKKQWGMYYINHHSTRRQKDLFGHEFTDGGMLSNFPIKYLDNDYMRPMYFSHKTTQNTKIYGFGLLSVKDEQYQSEKKQKICQQQFQVYKNFKNESFLLKFVLGIVSSSCKNWFCCPSTTTKLSSRRDKDNTDHQEEPQQLDSPSTILKPTLNQDEQNGKDLLHELKKIPLIQFGIALFNTYLNSDVNFEKECFAEEIYNTSFSELKDIEGINVPKQTWFSPYIHKVYVDKITEILTETMALLNIESIDFESKVMKNIEDNMEHLIVKLKNDRASIKEESLVNIASSLISFFTILYSQLRKNLRERSLLEEIKGLISILNKIITPTFFYRQSLVKDSKQLQQILNKYKQIHKQILVYKNQLREILSTEIAQKQLLVKNMSQYSKYLKNLPKNREKFVPLLNSSCLNWIALEKYHLIADRQKFKAIKSKSLEMSVPQLAIASYAWEKRRYLRSYVHRILSRNLYLSQSKKGYNVHVILQSKQISELYFNEYLIYLEQAIEDFNQINNISLRQERYRIKTITASGYQSLAAILYASKLPRQKLNNYIWNIKNSIEAVPNISENFSKMQWTKTNQKLIKEIEENVWKEKFNFFKEIQKKTEKNLSKGLQNFNFDEEILKLSDSRQQINLAFQRVIDYAVDALSIMDDEEIEFEDKKKKISELLTISYQNEKKLKKLNKDSKKFYEFILGRFEDLIKYTILVTPNINQNLLQRIQDQKIRKQAWKGTLLAQTLSNIKFKILIKEALNDMDLYSQCTLKQLYTSVKEQDRISVNLLAIKNSTSKITILNHNTRPEMPVWAAIMATSSTPYIHKPTPDARAWHSSNEWENRRLIAKYFGPQKCQNFEYLESGNNLSKIPLELITNRKLRHLIKASENESYIAFTFDDLPNKINGREISNCEKILSTSLKQMTIKPLDRYTLGKILFFDNLKQILSITPVTKIFQQLNININSQDNTFLDAYKKQSIQLPIKVNTLDFNRINIKDEKNPRIFHLSPIVIECIEDAKNVTKQKINNIDKIDSKIHRKLYIKMRRTTKKNQMKQVLSLEFVSAVIEDFFDMTQRYRIFYEFVQNRPIPLRQMDDISLYQRQKKLKEVKKDKIIIEDAEKVSNRKQSKINLKIIFAEKIIQDEFYRTSEQYQVSTVYHQLDISEFLKKKKLFRDVYQLHYNKFYGKAQNEKLQPQPSQQIDYVSLPIPIQSFNVELWQNSHICDNCGDQFRKILKKAIVSEKCGLCGKIGKVAYKCPNKKCTTTFCVRCKFLIRFDQNRMNCSLGHCICQQFNIDESEQFDLRNICDLCSSYRSTVYYDKECKVRICDFCVNKQKLRK